MTGANSVTHCKDNVKRRGCSVPGCRIKSGNNISVHYFPKKDAVIREKWRVACGIRKQITPYMTVCSIHFVDQDFFPRRPNQILTYLKPFAVPSLNLPKRSVNPKTVLNSNASVNYEVIPTPSTTVNPLHVPSHHETTGASSLLEGQPSILGLSSQLQHIPSEDHSDIDGSENMQGSSEQVNNANSRQEGESTLSEKEENTSLGIICRDCEASNKALNGHTEGEDVQVKSSGLDRTDAASSQDVDISRATVLLELQQISFPLEEKLICLEILSQLFDRSKTCAISITNLLCKDRELKAFTGIKFPLLRSLVDAVQIHEGHSLSHEFSVQKRIMMTLCKLRLNLSFTSLGTLYLLSAQNCMKYFIETIYSLSEVLADAIKWTSKEDVVEKLPKCFHREFFQLRVILESFEIPVRKPECSKCRLRLYCPKKGGEIVKILVGIEPSGLITFISKPHGGLTSYKTIINQSRLLYNLIPVNDFLMVTKEFSIAEECADRKIRLLKPPYLGQKEFTHEDAVFARKIALPQLHVETVFEILRNFKILTSQLEYSLIAHVEPIVRVVAAIFNQSNTP